MQLSVIKEGFLGELKRRSRLAVFLRKGCKHRLVFEVHERRTKIHAVPHAQGSPGGQRVTTSRSECYVAAPLSNWFDGLVLPPPHGYVTLLPRRIGCA